MLSHIQLFNLGQQPASLLCTWSFQAGILEQVAISYSRGSTLTQGLNSSLLHLCMEADCLPLSHWKFPEKVYSCQPISLWGCQIIFLKSFPSKFIFELTINILFKKTFLLQYRVLTFVPDF